LALKQQCPGSRRNPYQTFQTTTSLPVPCGNSFQPEVHPFLILLSLEVYFRLAVRFVSTCCTCVLLQAGYLDSGSWAVQGVNITEITLLIKWEWLYIFPNFIWRNPRDWRVVFCLFLSHFINRIFLTVLVCDKRKPHRSTTVFAEWSVEVSRFITLYIDRATYHSGMLHVLGLFRPIVLIMSHLTTLSASESIQCRATVSSESERTWKDAVLV
jgi:hypothetical protein